MGEFLPVAVWPDLFSRLAISQTSGCTGSNANSLHLEESVVSPVGCAFLPRVASILVRFGHEAGGGWGGGGKNEEALGESFSSAFRAPARDVGFSVAALFAPPIPAEVLFTRCGSALLAAGQRLRGAA